MTVNKITYQNLQEEVYKLTLESGLNVYLIPKPSFKETVGVLTANFGSLHTKYTRNGCVEHYPAGIAHFLEHKLFELDKGQDAATQFTKYGAESNAFTTFDKTSFYFSTISHITNCLDILLDFILTTNFTEESITKEKDIIKQEIEMYQDDPEYRLYQGVLSNLYPNSPLAFDIAGDYQSISQITLTDLQENHKDFYQLSNMNLVLVGQFSPQEIITYLQKNSHFTSYSQNIDRDSISLEPVIKNNSCHMTVTKPKLAIGYRKSNHMIHGSYLKEKIGLQLFFAMLLGWTSTINQDWYESGQIDDSFDIEIEVHPDFECVIISLDTTEPIAFSTQLRLLLKNALQSSDLTESHLKNVKRELYGDFLRSLDSIENLAMQFVTYLYDGKTMYLDLPSIVEELDLEDVITIGKDFLYNADTSDFVIFPKSS